MSEETQYTLETDKEHAADQKWINHKEWRLLDDLEKVGFEVKLHVIVTEYPDRDNSYNLKITTKKKIKINGKDILKSNK